MLPLKFLNDNRELATLISEAWHCDPTSREWFQYFRISSNAIYPLRASEVDNKGTPITVSHRAMLRFAPTSEKSLERLNAELDWMTFLHDKGYPVSAHVPNKKGDVAMELDSPWGTYVANVFVAAPGITMEEAELTTELAHRLGRLLGEFHKLNSVYMATREEAAPVTNTAPVADTAAASKSFLSVFDYCDNFINNAWGITALPPSFYRLASKLKSELTTLKNSTSPTRMGLIHYDFELDNLLYCKETDTITVIDFDDAMVSWYDMDLVRLLENMDENLSETLEAHQIIALQSAALDGYWEIWPQTNQGIQGGLDSQVIQGLQGISTIPHGQGFQNFMDLNWIYRAHYSLKEPVTDEPEWMINLRAGLSHRAALRLEKLEAYYGDSL